MAISRASVVIITAPINIENLRFTMLSTIVLHYPAQQEIPTAAAQPRNDILSGAY